MAYVMPKKQEDWLTTDSIERAALKKAGMSVDDLTGSGLAQRSANIADDIGNVRRANYQNALEDILDNSSQERVSLEQFLRCCSKENG